MTQQELEDQTDLKINYLSKLENGQRGIGFDSLNKIANVFGVPPELIVILAAEKPTNKGKGEDRLQWQIQKLARQAIDLHISIASSTH